MPESINTLKNELGGAFTILKSTHFTGGLCYSFVASVIPKDKYRIVINSLAWVYTAPVNTGAYAATALAAGVSVAQRKQVVTQHKEEQTVYANYLGSQEAGKELLLYSVADNVLALLKKQYINFGNATIHSMILHLQEKMAIKMTTSQKFEYKAEGYGKQWDPTTSITAYFTSLDKFRTSLANQGIATSMEEMTMAAGARMWESKMFTKDKNGCLGEQARRATNVAGPPGLLHGEMAGAPPVLAGDGKALVVQGRSTRCPRASSGGGRRQDNCNDVCTSPRATQAPDGGYGGMKPESNGRDDGADERPCCGS